MLLSLSLVSGQFISDSHNQPLWILMPKEWETDEMAFSVAARFLVLHPLTCAILSDTEAV